MDLKPYVGMFSMTFAFDNEGIRPCRRIASRSAPMLWPVALVEHRLRAAERLIYLRFATLLGQSA